MTALAPGCARAQTPLLRVGTNVFPGYEPLYLARDPGWRQEHLALPGGAQPGLGAIADRLAEFMLAGKLIKRNVDTRPLIDARVIERSGR